MKSTLKKILDILLFRAPNFHTKLLNFLLKRKTPSILKDLESKGLLINVIYDIGARHAEWSNFFKNYFSNANFILFEANDKCITNLKNSGFKYFINVLSSKSREVNFYDANSTGDSYFKENTSHYDYIKSVKRNAVTLDYLVKQYNLPKPDLIKLDTQGSELDILQGAQEALMNCSLVYLECPILSYNQGAPNFQHYLEYMNSIGFIPYDICENHYAHGTLIQVDILFISKNQLIKIFPLSRHRLHFI